MQECSERVVPFEWKEANIIPLFIQFHWKSVLSGVPQGSVLGPLLFLIYINDLDNNITSNILKFVDDTKVFRKVNTDGDKQHFQNDLDKISEMV